MCKSTQAPDLVGGGAGTGDVEEAPVSGVASEKPVLNPKRDREELFWVSEAERPGLVSGPCALRMTLALAT